jgi:hypothetical protein
MIEQQRSGNNREVKQRPQIERPHKKATVEKWREWLQELGAFATERDWLDFLETVGQRAENSDWDTYMDTFYSMDQGKAKGTQQDVYGDWVKPESEEDLEDTDQYHGLTCPLQLKATNTDPLGYTIDAPGDDPVGDEVEERLDREYFTKKRTG